MKQCGRCGTQNLDQQASCTACGFVLPPAGAPNFGGTLVMGPPGATPAADIGQPATPQPQAAPPAAAPAGPRAFAGTMLGIAPPVDLGRAAPPPASPSTGAAPPAGGASPRTFAGTMIGMAPPTGLQGPAPVTAPAAAGTAPANPGQAKLSSAQKTMLGVARPGIAPLNPGQAKPAASAPPPAAASVALPQAKPAASALAGAPLAPAPRRISLTAALAIVGSAMLLMTAAVAFIMLRGHGNVSARAALDGKGKEVLELTCSECPDGTRTWIDSAPVEFRSGKATLPLQAPLKVGENPLLLVLERPGRSREEIALSVPIEFRVRGSTEELAQEVPKVSVIASALEGNKLEVDGKPVTPDASGSVRFDYDVAEQLTGPEAALKTLERVVPYRATSSSGEVQTGQVEIRIGITPLIVDAPGASIVVDRSELVIAGRTAPGAALRVGGEDVGLDAEGRFVSKQPLKPGKNEILVRSTLKDHAPRLVKVEVRRVDDLMREVALAKATAQASYPEVLQLGDEAVGRSVALEGQLFDLRQDGYASILLLDVKGGCKKAPCLVKLLYGAQTELQKGRSLKAAGKVLRFVDGPRSGQRIPEVRADIVASGAS